MLAPRLVLNGFSLAAATLHPEQSHESRQNDNAELVKQRRVYAIQV